MKYVVEIKELLKCDVIVEAESRHEAEQKAERAYVRGDILMDGSNYSDVVVECIAEANSADVKHYPALEEEPENG